MSDDLDGIYEAIKENALLSKFAGGLGNDWTNVRAMGSHIKGTNGKSQGVVPFLKVVNDTAVAVNQGGKRKGAVCTYLETWHLDIEEFLELRKNTGDDRRRTHDMNTANWIPDLFMKRVIEGGDWTLFSPSDVPDLHDKWGRAFEEAYTRYEAQAARGEIKLFKKIPAVQLWRKMLSMLFETGHPWITFKDACNVRSPQQHVGTVHSSNLCTEITLNTSETEIAVCNLGSVNLLAHMKQNGDDGHGDWELDHAKLQRTIRTAMRMLDNVIDINYYAVAKARNSQPEAPPGRPRHHGLPGLPAPDAHAVRVGRRDEVRRRVDGSRLLLRVLGVDRARRRSAAATRRTRAACGTAASCRRTRSSCCATSAAATSTSTSRRRWTGTRCARASACTACATRTAWRSRRRRRSPTSSASARRSSPSTRTSTSSRTSPASSPSSTSSSSRDLKKLDLWDEVMVADLKYFDGSLAKIDRVPAELRNLYATAFEVDAKWIVEAGARRQKWIDQAQSLNIYMAGASGKKLDETYKLAWLRGLKTTYYLRTLAATSAEKSTGEGGELNAVSSSGAQSGSSAATGASSRNARRAAPKAAEPEPKYCKIDDPSCEACE